ncbi:O-antigen polymerase [Sorangium cellulosum]|uniref:O-antigen polymerase n=1 Tax=Sorangium cellulosum TaxID=56 RepID=A0A4P2PV76_SORCE|nr:O-antigen ligase family protein [Sorangium cellulosum]AUX20421.1 O-antigen polymerase [Sorangium cellulosum]
MLALPGVILLIIFIYGRPQEWDERFESLPFLYLWLGLAFMGMGLDLAMGKVRLKATPQLRWAIVVYLWCVFTLMVRNPAAFSGGFVSISVTFVLFFLIGHSADGFAGFRKLAATVLIMGLFVAGVSVHQGFSSWQCLAMTETIGGARGEAGIPDGRPCERRIDCYEQAGANPDAEYLCERVGLFKTSTINGRVRWRGVLQDPNELALTASIVLPFSFALFEQKRSFTRAVLVLVSLLVIATAVILTQSRGGQLVFATVLGVYFVKKYGIRGALFGALVAMPLMLLGGRAGGEADESASERTEILSEGLNIYRMFPLMGAGFRQFTEHHWLTAHNAYLLALAELGPLGMFAWTAMIYLTLKISLTALKRYEHGAQFAAIRAWSMAVLAGFCGMMVGIFFLSFTYHYVLWIYFGLAGSLYCSIKGVDPSFSVRLERRDVLRLVLGNVGLVTAIAVYTKSKGY